MSSGQPQQVHYRSYRGDSTSAIPNLQGSKVAASYSSTTRNDVIADDGTKGIIMNLFSFLTRFKTHLYAALALRTALILYGDHKVRTNNRIISNVPNSIQLYTSPTMLLMDNIKIL